MKKNIKCIALDMDFTLLNSRRECTPRTVAALRSAYDMGVTVTLATGRVYGQAVMWMRDMGFNAPMITSNGAVVRDRDTVYYKDILAADALEYTQRVAESFNTNYFFFGDKYVYFQKDNKGEHIISKWGGKEVLTDDGTPLMHPYDTHEELLAAAKGHTVKTLIFEEDLEKNALIKAELAKFKGLRVVNSEPTNLDISNPWIHKGIAVPELARALNIEVSEIMAAGDGENDKELIREAGFGVAMGNAVPSVKAVADYVADHVDNDGLARAIEEFVLGR